MQELGYTHPLGENDGHCSSNGGDYAFAIHVGNRFDGFEKFDDGRDLYDTVLCIDSSGQFNWFTIGGSSLNEFYLECLPTGAEI